MKKVSNEQLLVVFSILVIVSVAVYYYNKGKRKGTYIADIGDDYVRENFVPDLWSIEGNRLLTNFFVSGGERGDYLKRLDTLSDGELKTVYNDYNQRYLKDGKTFVQVIKDAWLTAVFETNPKTIILKRYEKLNLP